MTELKKANPIKKIKNQQFRFLRNALAEFEEDNKEIIDDEHWAFEVTPIPKKKPEFIIKSSYMDCIGFGIQSFSSKGFDPELEQLNVRLVNDNSKNLCDGLSEYMKQIEKNNRKRARSEDGSESEEEESEKEEEVLEEVPKKRKFMKPE